MLKYNLETTLEIVIVISTVLFHALSAALLILMFRAIMKEDKARISKGGAEKPSQQTD